MSRTWQSLKKKSDVLPVTMTSSCGNATNVMPLSEMSCPLGAQGERSSAQMTMAQAVTTAVPTTCVKSPAQPVESSKILSLSGPELEITAEQIEAAKKERWFPRYPCPICPLKTTSVFKIDGARICLFCFDKIKQNSKLDLDAIHALNLNAVKKYVTEQSKPESNADEPPDTKPRKIRRSRNKVKETVRE